MTTAISYHTDNGQWQDAGGNAYGINQTTFEPNGDPFVAAGTSGTRPDGVKWAVLDIGTVNGKTMCHIVWYLNGQPTSFDYLSLAAVQAMRTDDANSIGLTLP